jgi:hypothetical protein
VQADVSSQKYFIIIPGDQLSAARLSGSGGSRILAALICRGRPAAAALLAAATVQRGCRRAAQPLVTRLASVSWHVIYALSTVERRRSNKKRLLAKKGEQ